ncbi:conserved phage C-terminal domain-containing protein [Lactococcus lactis subsp. lactis]|uniref:conserved phage C-terminal domain-containing protein n=1 Tax=Lactococcus lactis TaxID=1358 RepID=UPI0029416462|nr:conserved phage C-terminal domain-containing protein [Lactococcus lactis]MDV4193052.1 conserved phage C-terminal domain-containing protein [Lactococcus lactis subsp. lactis]
MFSKEVTTSDLFVDMPSSSQLLYFHLGMEADDEGFIGNAKMLSRAYGSNNDDLKLLEARGFIIAFPSGVTVVKDWNLNNKIRKDRQKPTIYTEEKTLLSLDSKGSYLLDNQVSTIPQPNDNQMSAQDRIGEVRLGKDSIGKSNNTMSDKSDDVIPYSEIISYLNEKTGRSFRTTEAHKRFIKARWNENYKLDDFKRVVDNKVADWTGKTINGQPAEKYLQPSTLFGTKFDNYLNQAPMHQEQAQPYDDLGLPF